MSFLAVVIICKKKKKNVNIKFLYQTVFALDSANLKASSECN